MVNSKKKRRNRRSKVSYPNLDPQYNLKTRSDEILDLASYAHTLPPDAKRWLDNFARGYINADRSSPLFTKPEDWKKNEDRNNARNRCIMTRAKAQGQLNYFSELTRPDSAMRKNEGGKKKAPAKMLYDKD